MSHKRCKEGVLSKRTEGIRKEWKQFKFKYSQAYFQYFKDTIEEERISWMEAIRPGSAVNLRGAAPQPHIDLTMSCSQQRQQQQQHHHQQLPYMLVPVQQQPLPPQRPQQPSLPQHQPQPQPAVTQLPPRQPSQHSIQLINSPVESGREPEPCLQPGEGIPPIHVAPLQLSHSILSNSEENAPSTAQGTTVAPVDAVVGIMKNMSTDQMQMLVQKLSKLNPGEHSHATLENILVQPHHQMPVKDILLPSAVPPVAPSRSSSNGPLKHAHTFPEMDTNNSGYMKVEPSSVPIRAPKAIPPSNTSSRPSPLKHAHTFSEGGTDENDYILDEPASVPIRAPKAIPPSNTSSRPSPLKHAHTFSEGDTDDPLMPTLQSVFHTVSWPNSSNPEESTPPDTPTTTTDPVAPVSEVVGIKKSMSTDQMQMLIQMLSKLNPGEATLENSPLQHYQLFTTISQSPDLECVLLTTEDDEEYRPRPEWAKANANSTEDDLGQSSDLQREALFISSSSLTDHVPIGKGQFGEVFRATLHKGTPGEVMVAVKTTNTNSTVKDRADFMKEMAVMSTLLHPNIVRLYGLVNENQDSPSIVLEYLPNGDLKHFLTKNPRPIKQLVKYMIDVAMGMHYISEKGLIHRDLAARNVLVGENEVCKVADFGLLRELPEENSIYQSAANAPLPVRWMAPECIQRRKFSVASDVWSYGILMWEMFNPSKVPYPNMTNMECISKVSEGFRLAPPRGAPSIIVRLMKACWHKQPEKRPSFLIISTLLTTKAFAEIEMSSSSKS